MFTLEDVKEISRRTGLAEWEVELLLLTGWRYHETVLTSTFEPPQNPTLPFEI